MPDATHPIAPRGLSPITELTTPLSIHETLPPDEQDHPHPSYASVREGGSDRSSVYSQGSGGTATPRARRTSLPPDLAPPLSRPPALVLAPSRDPRDIDSPLTLPGQVSTRKPFPSPRQPGGLPPPPRRRGTPPPTSPTRPTVGRPHSWQPRSRAGSNPIEEESESYHSDEGPQASLSSAGQAGIGARSNFEASVEEEVPRLEEWAEVLSPASTLLVPRPSVLRQAHSSPAMIRPIEPAIPSPPVPQVELLSQSLKVSPDATPPISPAGSQRINNSRSVNLLRKRAKSMNGTKTSPKVGHEGSSDRPRSVLGTSTLRMGSSSSLGKRQLTPPRRGSSYTPTLSRPSSREGSASSPSIRTRKGSKSASRRFLVSSLFSLFDPSHRQRTDSHASPPRARTESTATEDLLSVEPQTAIRTSGTFGVRDDGSVLEDPNKSPGSMGHTRTRTESGPALSALSGSGSVKSMGAGRVLYVQNSGRQSEERSEARESMETLPMRKRVPSFPLTPLAAPLAPPLETPAITSSPEQTVPILDTALILPSDLPRPIRARRDISKGSSTSEHTFGETSPGQTNPSPRRRDSKPQTPPLVPLIPAGFDLSSLDLSRAGPESRPGSSRASPIRPLPRPPSASPRVAQTPSIDILHADTIDLVSNRPLSDISNQGSESITPRASQIPQDLHNLHIPGPTLNIPGPPSNSPSPSRESSWYAPAPELGSSGLSIPSDEADKDSPPQEHRQAGPRVELHDDSYPSRGPDHPRHSHESNAHSRHSQSQHRPHLPHLSHIPGLPGLAGTPASAAGSTDLPFLIASHVLSSHAAQLMQHSTDIRDVSEAIRRMAKESLDWGGVLMRLSNEARTGRAGHGRRPMSMPQSFPPGVENLRELLERMRHDQAPPVPDLPEPFRQSARPSAVPPGAYDPLYDAWLRLHGQRRPSVHDPFAGFPDYRHLSAYHHPYPRPADPYPPAPMHQSFRLDDVTHPTPQTPARHQRQRRTQSLEYPLEWVREADRLGTEGWTNLHQAEEAWTIAMRFLKRVVEEGHELATPGRARPYTTPAPEFETSTGGRGWRYYQPPQPQQGYPSQRSQRLSDEFDRSESRTIRSRQPSPTPKVGSTRASTPSRYGPEGSGPPPPMPPLPFSPILESPESQRQPSFSRRRSDQGTEAAGGHRGTSFLPRAEDKGSAPRSQSPSVRRSEIKARRVLGKDVNPITRQEHDPVVRSQSYTFPVPSLRPDLEVVQSDSVGLGVMMPLAEALDLVTEVRPNHGRQKSHVPSTIGSKGTGRKLRKGMKRTLTGGTLRTMGSGTMRRAPTPTIDGTMRRPTSRQRQRPGSRSSTRSRGSRSGSEVRVSRPKIKRHWWSRRK